MKVIYKESPNFSFTLGLFAHLERTSMQTTFVSLDVRIELRQQKKKILRKHLFTFFKSIKFKLFSITINSIIFSWISIFYLTEFWIFFSKLLFVWFAFTSNRTFIASVISIFGFTFLFRPEQNKYNYLKKNFKLNTI